MENKNVFILNYASHYRIAIFKKINDELDADLYFGDIPNSTIKKIEYADLSNFKKEFKTIKVHSLFWFKGSYKLVFKYNNIILTGDPHILSNWIILIFARLLGKKTYLWTHGWYGKEKGLKKGLKKIYFLMANKILLYGDYAKKIMIDEGFKEGKLIPIYNSLDYGQQLLIRDNLKQSAIYIDHFKNDYPVIIFIGRIQKVKRLDLILEALHKLNKENYFLNLVIVGGNAEDVDIVTDVVKYNIEKQVWFFGPSYDEEINAELIYNADLCISAGNVGLTAIHSLMYGTPVLTHNNFSNQMPEFESIVENYTGAFFEENNVDDLVFKIKQLLNENLQPENCHEVIDTKWNPNNQISILKNTLRSYH